MENMDNIVKAHIEDYGKDFILSEVEDIKCDFLPDTWEELFDDESNCISLFDIKEEQYQHTRMLLNTIKFNLGQTFLPIF